MASKRITQSAIDWSRFAQIVPQSERQMFNAFKAKSDTYLRKMMSNPETPPQIDWAYYKKNVINKSLVDQLESAYKAVSVTYPKDTLSHEVDEQEKKNQTEVEEFARSSKLVIDEANKLLEKFNLMIPVKDMTLEEYHLTFPDWTVCQWKQPSWFPHSEATPGLTKEQREEITKPDGPPYSLI